MNSKRVIESLPLKILAERRQSQHQQQQQLYRNNRSPHIFNNLLNCNNGNVGAELDDSLTPLMVGDISRSGSNHSTNSNNSSNSNISPKLGAKEEGHMLL